MDTQQVVKSLFVLAMISALLGPPLYLGRSRPNWSKLLRAIGFVWFPGSLVELTAFWLRPDASHPYTWCLLGWAFGYVYCGAWFIVFRTSYRSSGPRRG